MLTPEMIRTAIQVFAAGLAFVAFSALVFWPLEEIFESEKSTRPKFKVRDQLWFYQSYGLWIAAGIIYWIAYFLRQFLPLSWLTFVQHQPFWLQAVVALLMAETWVYAAHRLSHKSNFLWKFHSVHHTVTEMTWSASSRQHPVDFLFIIVGGNLPARSEERRVGKEGRA